jgi:NAD(P)-dependent dehydrogenase (short-subunit alcohol dehydrogenase family)
MEWSNQVAVVTGGSRGIGQATARLLAQRGAAVCVNYAMHADAAKALVAEITTAGGRAIAVAADVADSAAVEAMVAHTEAELGPVTILVNNAGVSWQGMLDTYDREQVARMRQVNVDGVIHATRAVIGSMRAQRYGRIVNMASIAGIGVAFSLRSGLGSRLSPRGLRPMSDDGRRGRPSGYEHLKYAVPEPGDELVGDWPRSRLLKMNERFVQCVELAFATGCERREAAAATMSLRGVDDARAR